jgi:hypothetical protein
LINDAYDSFQTLRKAQRSVSGVPHPVTASEVGTAPMAFGDVCYDTIVDYSINSRIKASLAMAALDQRSTRNSCHSSWK